MNLPLNIDFLQILLHMLNFVILAGGLSILLYKPVVDFMKKREEHFDTLEKKNVEDAQENARLREEYEQKLAKADEEVAELKATAERECAQISAQYIEEAKSKAAVIIRTAEEEAEDRKEHILDSAQTEIGELVVAATQKLLSDTVTPERNSTLYDEFIRIAENTVSESRAKHDRK